MNPTVGFIGLGVLGSRMARRVLDAGFPLTVWNRTQRKAEPLHAAGARVATTPADVARTCDILAMCVTDREAVTAIAFGPDGLHTVPARKQLVIDHSSIAPDATRSIADRLFAANGISWLDAPVSGGTPAAERGTLTVMAGGSTADFDRALPVLRCYARRHTLMGPVGSGQATKLCNQIIVAATTWGIAEAATFARASGIPPESLLQGLAGGFADSALFQHYLPLMSPPHDQAIGSLEDLVKDLDAALTQSRATGTPLPLAAHLAELLRIANKWTPPQAAGSFIGLLHGKPDSETTDIPR
ncbi:2-hydroxy-3-oxopropionate reductase [Actinomadura rubteroloni]|uniref:2-hydroxy-3-oxopropionate reductase n=1 Tax=Actinomadura rubteroloni TaxID=1926885 RepID=A0A2P4UE39_9ACTN|nr:NAD(P)-dependent oxidoreductase [Actinomadura rubteroloni]POM23320.1 2-hydroxy-3-oxopropionate reductase [Actinomadura rubteroloni]